MDGTAILISFECVGEDKIGQEIQERIEKEIFVTEKSVGRNEFYAAGRNGLRPDIYLTTSEYNYNGETEILYKGHLYTIYRTYHSEYSDDVELYIERRSGNVGKNYGG